MKKDATISIIGGTIWGNRGAEAMLVTTIGRLRESIPNARFNIFSYYPQKDRDLIQDELIQVLSAKPLSLATRHFFGALSVMLLRKLRLKIPRGRFFKIARVLAESDVLLDIGGITFSDGREKFLPFNILSIWPAMLLGVPVVKMAQALGPFHQPMNRMSAKYFLKRCRHIFARGVQTGQFLAELGLPGDQFDPAADIAFLYQPGDSLSHENDDRLQTLLEQIHQARRQGKQVIIFSPSVLVEKQSHRKGLDYAGRFLEAIVTLPSGRYFYVFMPNATRAGSQKLHNNDLVTIMNFKHQAQNGDLSKDRLVHTAWINFDINTASIRMLIAEADVLVTSRYHAMISGLCLSIPTIVMGWGHKYLETMAYFDLQDYSLDFGDADVELAAWIEKAIREEDAIREKIRRKFEVVQQLASIPFLWLKDMLA